MGRRLYTALSLFEFIWTLLLRLACIFGLIFSLQHYKENPIAIVIVSAICFLLIFIIGDDQIIVYQDRITQTTNSFSSLIFKSKGRTFDIAQIKSAYLQSIPKLGPTEIGAIVLLTLIVPKRNANSDKTRPIFFKLKSGEIVKFDTNLEHSKMKRIVEIVNSLTS